MSSYLWHDSSRHSRERLGQDWCVAILQGVCELRHELAGSRCLSRPECYPSPNTRYAWHFTIRLDLTLVLQIKTLDGFMESIFL